MESEKDLKTAPDPIHGFILDQHYCALCENKLDITVVVEPTSRQVRESAHCLTCGLKTREKEHTLH